MTESLKNVLDFLKNCIHNGHEVIKICDDAPGAVKSNPLIQQFIDKIKSETGELEDMLRKFSVLMQSNKPEFYAKWKIELQAIIESMESMSNENCNQIMDAVTKSKISKAKRNFQDFEKLVKDFKGDDVTKDFAKMLMERNGKIINCLNKVISMLPKAHVDNLTGSDATPKSRKKLFIFSDDLQRTIISPATQRTQIGSVNIQSDGAAAHSASVTFSNQTMTQRRSLNGFLQDEGGSTEVVLELREPTHDSVDLIDFSGSLGKHNATIALEGGQEENIEVYEINLMDMSINGAPMIALVENNRTGEYQEVPVEIVPTNPNNDVHGPIVSLQSPGQGINLKYFLELFKTLNNIFQLQHCHHVRVHENRLKNQEH